MLCDVFVMRQSVVSDVCIRYYVVLTQGVSHHHLGVELQVVQVPVVDRVKRLALGWIFSSVL